MCKRFMLALVAAIGVALAPPAHAHAASPPATEGLGPVANGITVLTYNTHVFKDSSGDRVGFAVKDGWNDLKKGLEHFGNVVQGEHYTPRRRQYVFDDDDRAKFIAARVRGSGADIVALQEIWAYERQKRFVRELKDVYPHWYYAPYEKGRDLNVLEEKTGIIRQAGKTSSGLLLLSKYRLKEATFFPFPDKRTTKQEDQWATKGVITAMVEPWRGGPTFRVGITHACTDTGGKDQPDISDLAAKTVGSRQEPAIMMGDFNVPQKVPQKVDGFDLRLMSSANHVSEMPAKGKNLITVAKVKDVLHFRIYDADGNMVVDKDKTQLTDKAPQIKELESLLSSLWSVSQLSQSDKDTVMTAVISIVDNAYANMRDIFKRVDATDACLRVGTLKSGYTVNRRKNLLDQTFAPYDRLTAQELKKYTPVRLDYVFVKESGPGLTLIPEKAEVLRDWTYPRKVGGWRHVWENRWDSDCVAVVSFQLKKHPYLFCLKGGDENKAYVFRIADDGRGWTAAHGGGWNSDFVGTAITTFELNGHPYIFALYKGDRASITRINDEGKGWEKIYSDRWSHHCVAVKSFQLKGHPYLFCLKGKDEDKAYIFRINDNGKGWTATHGGKWSSYYVGTAITTFELNGHPYIFALKKKKGLLRHGDTAWITRINDDGKGWKHIYIGPWSHDYVAVQSFQLRGHPYLFALKGNDKAYIFRIKDDGKGWTLVDGGNWNSNYVGTAITPFYLEDNPYVFALKGRPHNQAWIAQLHEPHMMKMDLSDHYPLKVKFRVVREE